eukprot:7381093-Prymnesium_polylepis.2
MRELAQSRKRTASMAQLGASAHKVAGPSMPKVPSSHKAAHAPRLEWASPDEYDGNWRVIHLRRQA